MNSRTCKRIERWLGPYSDFDLPLAKAAWVADHLRICPDCRERLAAIRTFSTVVEQQRDEMLKTVDWAEFDSQLSRRLAERKHAPSTWKEALEFFWRPAYNYVAVAVSVLLLATVAFLIWPEQLGGMSSVSAAEVEFMDTDVEGASVVALKPAGAKVTIIWVLERNTTNMGT